jgi:hypothetical protein
MLNCAVDHILQKFYTLFLTRFRTYKIASPPRTKMTSWDDIRGLVSLKFLCPWYRPNEYSLDEGRTSSTKMDSSSHRIYCWDRIKYCCYIHKRPHWTLLDRVLNSSFEYPGMERSAWTGICQISRRHITSGAQLASNNKKINSLNSGNFAKKQARNVKRHYRDAIRFLNKKLGQ